MKEFQQFGNGPRFAKLFVLQNFKHATFQVGIKYLGTVHLIFGGGGGGGGGPGIYVWAGKFFFDNIGARLFFSPALWAGLFFS